MTKLTSAGDEFPCLGVVVVTYAAEAHIAQCLEALFATMYPALTTVVVDNASRDGTREEVRRWASGEKTFRRPVDWPLPSVAIVTKPIRLEERHVGRDVLRISDETQLQLLSSPRNFGFAGGVNIGLRVLLENQRIKFFWILNSDCVTYPETPFAFVRHAQRVGEFSIMGGRLVFLRDPSRIQADGGLYNRRLGLTRLLNLGRPANGQALPDAKFLDFIPGANMFVSRSFLQAAGPMDESWFLYGEDVDWAFRRGTLPLAVAPGARVAHHAGASIGSSSFDRLPSPIATFLRYRNHLRFVARWHPACLPTAYAAAILKIGRDFIVRGVRTRQLAAALHGLHGRRPPRVVEAFFDQQTWAIIRLRRTDSSAVSLLRRTSNRTRETRGRRHKGRRLLKSILDPRAYLHLLKLINFYNYSHVRELRLILLGRNVSIAPSVMFANGDRIAIDDGTIIGPRCYLWAGHEFGHIFIGRNVMFGPQVMVTAATYRFHDGSPMRDQAMEEEDVVIGDDVWIGTGAVILPGARIGEGSVIGAGSIVRGEIPPRSIAVGAPARVAGHR